MAGLSQAAAQLGCSVETIRRRIKTGEINATKVSGVWDIDLTEEATETPQDAHTAVNDRVVDLLESRVTELQRQLEVREREIGQLHTEIMQLHQLLGQRQLETATNPRPWWKRWSR